MFWSDDLLIACLNTDQIFYTRITMWMGIIGEESPYIPYHLFHSDYTGFVIYHYYELWLGSIISYLASAPIALLLIVHTFFVFLVYLGSVCLFEVVIKEKKILSIPIYLFCVLFPFSSSIYLASLAELKIPSSDAYHFIYGDHAVAFIHLKMAVLESFFLAILICFWKRYWYSGVVLMLMLVVISPATAPSLLILSCLIALYIQFCINRNAKISRYDGYKLLFISFFIALLLGGLSYLFAPNLTSISQYNDFTFSSKNIKFAFMRMVQQPILYLPFSLFFFFLIRKRKDMIVVYSVLIVTASVFGNIFIEMNWKQFFSMVVFPNAKILFTTLTIALSINELSNSYSTRKRIILGSLILLSTAVLSFRTLRNIQLKHSTERISDTTYETNAIATIDSLAKVNNNRYVLGGSYLTREDFKKIAEKNPIFAEIIVVGNSSYYANTPVFILNFNLIDYLESENVYLKQAVRRNPIYKYADENNILLKNKDKLFYKFSRDNNITFFVVGQIEELPTSIQQRIVKVIHDKDTKMYFCVVRYD